MNIRRHKQTYPALYESGFVDISETDIENIFLGAFDSPRRKILAYQLKLFVNKLKALGVKGELWIDGSFSTKNPTPMDIDVLLVIPRITLSGMTEEAKHELGELADNREYVRAKWGCDLYVIEASNIGKRKYYEDWFSRNPDKFNKKGIPVIKL